MHEAIIRLELEPLEEGGFVATSPDVPGLVAQGRTIAEVSYIAQDIARKIAEMCLEHGDPLPPALTTLRSRETSVCIDVAVSVPN